MSFGFHTWNDAHDVDQVIEPAASAGTVTASSYKDMRTYTKGLVIIYAGTVPGTLDASVYQATDSSGTSAKALSNSSITQLSSTGDSIAIIEFDVSKLDHSNNFFFVSPRLVKTNASTVAGAALVRTRAKGLPVTQSADEVVEVLSN